MSENKTMISLAARCNAAGRPNNEDNFNISADIAAGRWQFVSNEVIELGEKGALLVACDGMGGMNAGEVASEIAVQTIKVCFASDKVTDDVIASDSSIKRFIVSAIQTADSEIKKHGKAHPETSGMGSTIVIAWILGDRVHVGWCGDSRAYRFNPENGLERLSHDHSYVQELVDAGKLSEELAFDHPNSNVITRSLGDPGGKARPDVKAYDLAIGDIILLCSDGLCGTLRDPEIADIISSNATSMQQCCDALWIADEQAGWTDNVTTLLARIESLPSSVMETPGQPPQSDRKTKPKIFSSNEIRLRKKVHLLSTLLILVFVLLVGGTGFFVYKKHPETIQRLIGTDDSTLVNHPTDTAANRQTPDNAEPLKEQEDTVTTPTTESNPDTSIKKQ